jgi:hypothetical protein
MSIWRMPIAENGGHATYAEIRDRHVVACGWSDLGNLTCLYQACRAGLLAWQQVRPLLQLLAEVYDPPVGRAFYNSFRCLFCDIAVGDIVIAYVGVNPVGICQICDCVTYLYDNGHDDNRHEYAHCLFGVEWVDWVDFTAFVVGHRGPDVNPGNPRVPGIVRNRVHVPEIEQEWAAYRAAHMPAGPCSQEILNRCQELTAAAPNDCAAQFSYWRSIPMYREIEAALNLKKQIILYGPPGTGKTYLAKQFVLRHWSLTDDRYRVVQFHPAYNYEDFVRGVQVKTVKGQVQYDTVHRIFSEMCIAARDDPDPNKKYALIIDEINRANLASVLGELIYGLEYRGDPVRTPYKVNGSHDLIVPDNLYIIGTMNTADRSIGHIDYAVRRRFAFIPMAPESKVITQVVPNGVLRDSALLLFNAVSDLFRGQNCALAADFFADDVQPGHSYFLANPRENDPAHRCEALLMDFVYQVLPLLHEYVKDGVLTQNAAVVLSNLRIPLKDLNARRPEEWATAIRAHLPCFNPPQHAGAHLAPG